jgi:hypothetical protein
MALIPLESIAEKSESIKWYTLIVACVIVALVILVSIWVSLRMYSPIRNIRRFISPDSKSVTGDELHYIGDRVKHLVQDQSRMVGEIKGLNQQAGMFFVNKLLLGEIKQKEIEEGLERYKFPLNMEQWCVLSMQIDTIEDTFIH